MRKFSVAFGLMAVIKEPLELDTWDLVCRCIINISKHYV
jgi:hypothetical protein